MIGIIAGLALGYIAGHRLAMNSQDKKISFYKGKLNQLAHLVWNNFSARDSKGKTDETRNVEEVGELWEKYHNIVYGTFEDEVNK